MRPLFSDRAEAGRRLAAKLREFTAHPDVVVLGLPRGGVVVAFEAAQALELPLDVFVVRKLGLPGQEEYAIGAIASGGIMALNRKALDELGIDEKTIHMIVERESRELARREQVFRRGHTPLDLHGKIVILVDDGLATGATMRSAVAALKRMEPAKVIVAVPVGAVETCASFDGVVDRVICEQTPAPFYGVGMWYDNFSQTTDEEVVELLERRAAVIESHSEQKG